MSNAIIPILGVNVISSSYQFVSDKALEWAHRGESRGLVFANVHVIMEAHDDPAYSRCLNTADTAQSSRNAVGLDPRSGRPA